MTGSSEKTGGKQRGRLRNVALETSKSILALQRRTEQALAQIKTTLEERSQELTQSLSLLNATLESSSNGIVVVDLAGKVISHNSRFATLWQLPAELLERRDGTELDAYIALQVKDGKKLLQLTNGLQSNPETEVMDVVELSDGRTFERYSCPQRISCECVGVVVNWHDITKRKQAEEMLRVRLKEIICLHAIRRGMGQELTVAEACEWVITHLRGAMQFPEISTARIELDGRRFTSGKYDQNLTHRLQAQIMVNGKICGQLRLFYSDNKQPFLLPEEQYLVDAVTDDLGKWLERMQVEAARKEHEALIWRQANFDPLTNLPNRRMFYDRLEQEIKKSNCSGLSLALLLFDLDNFKQINNTFGHTTGDMLLKDAAQRLGSCVRESDTVAHLGGDEFTVILGGLADPDTVEGVIQNALRKLAEPFQLKNEVTHVSASVGIAFYPADAADSGGLLKSADQAMYAAKKQGHNRYGYFTASLQQAAQARILLVNNLRGALAGNQLRVYYQPIVELLTGVIHKAEALLRWQHPTRGLIEPAEFIPIAEDTGMIIDIGDWVFRETASQVAIWRSSHHAEFQISVNRSPVQFHSDDNNHAWFDHLQKLGLPGQSIVVEITERLLLDTDVAVTNQLLAFRDAGMQVSLDDFGTGYSSLAYLKKYDIDYLKIDRSFIHNLAPASNDMALCEAIIVMAHKLGLKVIAEGVETIEQRDLLAAAGCDYGQGHLFSKAVPAEQFEALLQSARQSV